MEQKSINIDNKAMYKLSYGLFVLTTTTREDCRDNGCIINTVTQITDSPKRISIAVNNANFTCEMLKKSGVFNVSVLTTETPFEVFEHFGFQSGRNVDKFQNCKTENRTQNGVLYLPKYVNSVISGEVFSTQEVGTHTLFLADVTEAFVVSETLSATYQYYFDNIKPKPVVKKSSYVCKICGYVYEGDPLPKDFICPICKHGAEDFEKVE